MSPNIKDDRVLALKYRPEKFEDLIGQNTISQTLSLALDSKRLSHAYLFSGLRGLILLKWMLQVIEELMI